MIHSASIFAIPIFTGCRRSGREDRWVRQPAHILGVALQRHWIKRSYWKTWLGFEKTYTKLSVTDIHHLSAIKYQPCLREEALKMFDTSTIPNLGQVVPGPYLLGNKTPSVTTMKYSLVSWYHDQSHQNCMVFWRNFRMSQTDGVSKNFQVPSRHFFHNITMLWSAFPGFFGSNPHLEDSLAEERCRNATTFQRSQAWHRHNTCISVTAFVFVDTKSQQKKPKALADTEKKTDFSQDDEPKIAQRWWITSCFLLLFTHFLLQDVF